MKYEIFEMSEGDCQWNYSKERHVGFPTVPFEPSSFKKNGRYLQFFILSVELCQLRFLALLHKIRNLLWNKSQLKL